MDKMEVTGGEVAALVEPWQNFHGELPDYDHPLRCVYESGIQYAVELLAKELGVENWEACDGTEEFDGDLGGTMMNIVCAALPKDVHGDRMWPSQVAEALAERDAEIARLREALVVSVGEMSLARGRLEIIGMCNEDRRIAAALGGAYDNARQALGDRHGQ